MMLLFVLDLDVHMPTFPENTIFYENCMIFAYADDVGQAHFDSVPQVVMGGKSVLYAMRNFASQTIPWYTRYCQGGAHGDRTARRI